MLKIGVLESYEQMMIKEKNTSPIVKTWVKEAEEEQGNDYPAV